MLCHIRHTTGLGNAAIYVRLRGTGANIGKFWDWVGLAWVTPQTNDCRLFMTEYNDTDTLESLYAVDGTIPAGATYIQEAVTVSDGLVLGYDTTLVETVEDIQTNVSAAIPTSYSPTSVVKNSVGAMTGTYVTLASHDDTSLNLAEAVADGISLDVIRSTSTLTEIPSLVRVTGYYNGSASHEVYIQVYNYFLVAWETKATMKSRTTPFDYIIPMTSDNHDTGTGEMKLRFLHSTTTYNASHDLYLDWVSWEKVETSNQMASDIANIYSLLLDVVVDTGTDIPASLTTIEGKIDTIDSIVDAILVDTGTTLDDKLDSIIVSIADKTGYALSAAGVDAILDDVVEGSYTLRKILRIGLAVLAGKSSGGGTATLTFRDVADSKDRVTATVTNQGNRSAITLDGD